MHTTESLLEAVKARHGLASDYKLAKCLGITQNRISGYRSGRSRPDDVTAALIAEAAGLDVGYVLACLHAERAQSDAARSLWEALAARLQAAGATAAAVILSAGVFASPDAGAMSRSAAAPSNAGGSVYYVNRLAGVLRRMRRHVASRMVRASPALRAAWL